MKTRSEKIRFLKAIKEGKRLIFDFYPCEMSDEEIIKGIVPFYRRWKNPGDHPIPADDPATPRLIEILKDLEARCKSRAY